MNYEAIRAAMQAELDEPLTSYMPNSPGGIIRDRLFSQAYWDEAVWFWDGYCRGGFSIPDLDLLLHKVKAINAHEKMPSWGTYGT